MMKMENQTPLQYYTGALENPEQPPSSNRTIPYSSVRKRATIP